MLTALTGGTAVIRITQMRGKIFLVEEKDTHKQKK